MFIKNNKGAALMQVLLVTVVLAGMAAMLLRATLSRTITARHTRRSVSTQLMVDSCMAEVNSLWASKSPEAFLGDFNGDGRGAFMYCESIAKGSAQILAQPIPDNAIKRITALWLCVSPIPRYASAIDNTEII